MESKTPLNNRSNYSRLDTEIQDATRVWLTASEIVRAGIKRGFTDPSILFRAAAGAAHCCRGRLHLLDAHKIAADALSWEVARARI